MSGERPDSAGFNGEDRYDGQATEPIADHQTTERFSVGNEETDAETAGGFAEAWNALGERQRQAVKVLGGAAAAAVVFFAGSQVGSGESDEALEDRENEVDTVEAEEDQDDEGLDEAEVLDDTEEETEPPSDDEGSDEKSGRGAEDTEGDEAEYLGMGKDEWIESWRDNQERINGRRVEEFAQPEVPRGINNSIMDNFSEKLERAKTDGEAVDVTRLKSANFIIENQPEDQREIIEIRSPLVYGIYHDGDDDSERHETWLWTENPQEMPPEHDKGLVVIYPDQAGDWQTFTILWNGEVEMPSDDTTQLVATFARAQPDERTVGEQPHLEQFQLDPEQDGDDLMTVDSQDYLQPIAIPPEKFTDLEATWNRYEDRGRYVPIDLRGMVQTILDQL